jgi:urocanate hydratase
MGDIFSLGFGPFRWVCTSGDPADLRATDAIAASVLKGLKAQYEAEATTGGEAGAYAAKAVGQVDDNLMWITEAEGHQMVVGSQARIL